MPSKKTTSAAKLAMKIPAAIGDKAIVSITTTAPTAAPVPPDVEIFGADAVLQGAMEVAQPGQEPELPPPPADDTPPGPPPSPALAPEPAPQPAAAACPPIHDLADARALPDVTCGVYQLAMFDSPLAIRAFKDDDGRTMAVVFTGYTLAKAAITDWRRTT